MNPRRGPNGGGRTSGAVVQLDLFAEIEAAGVIAPAAATQPAAAPAPFPRHTSSATPPTHETSKSTENSSLVIKSSNSTVRPATRPARTVTAKQPSSATDTSYRCTNQIDYTGDPRDNATINSVGAETGHCPTPIH